MACDGGSGGGSLTDRREYLKLLVGASGALAGCYLPGNSTDWTRPRRSMVRSAVFGPSVAIDGETALVGATWNREGDEPDVDTEIAFVFSRESGEWTPEAMLRPDSPAGGFGDSVALAGDVALVGARLDNRPPPDSTETDTKPSDDTIKRRGSVSVFARTSGEWSREAIHTPNDAESWNRFGFSVAMDTDTAVVGANGYSRHPDGTESAYIFERTEEGWTQQARLTGDVDRDSNFGRAVAIDEATAVIGASSEVMPNSTRSGAAYVFVRRDGEWTRQAKLSAEVKNRATLGRQVAVDGDTAFLSAPGANTVHVFSRTGEEWSKQTELFPDDIEQKDFESADPGDKFGESVALAADVALVGAPTQDDGEVTWAGAVYVFTRTETGWQRRTKLTDDGGDSLDEFGTAVALSGDTALVTAPYDEDTDGEFAGTTHTFVRSNGSWEQQVELTASDAGPFETATKSAQSSPPSPETASPSQNTTTTSLDEQSGERN